MTAPLPERRLVGLIQEANVLFIKHGFAALESITVDRATAEALKAETSLVRKYASTMRLPHNCMMIGGTLVVAPVNFNFGD